MHVRERADRHNAQACRDADRRQPPEPVGEAADGDAYDERRERAGAQDQCDFSCRYMRVDQSERKRSQRHIERNLDQKCARNENRVDH